MNLSSAPRRAAPSCLLAGLLIGALSLSAPRAAHAAEPAPAEPAAVLDLWPEKPPGEVRKIGPEQDFTKPEDKLIAGRKIIKLGNVSVPQMHVFLPPKERRNGAAAVVCPGGGFQILAWDLEGTEAAEWLNSLGVAALVLKYRVPKAPQDAPWLAAVQDAQRAMSLARGKAAEWDIDPDRLGVLGFSAGGLTAARVAAQHDQRAYEAADEFDRAPFRPAFAVLIYPGGMLDEKSGALKSDFTIGKATPPTFIVHAEDDPVSCENSVQLFSALKKAGVRSELHVYDAGGHGYGLRPLKAFPVTAWPKACETWLARGGWLKPAKSE
ncbi:MAG TPA: alpha/beta hydrolase [Pirellulales bacterium]|nr:alpha/beta hydrolase [Pirellulales bacterium]